MAVEDAVLFQTYQERRQGLLGALEGQVGLLVRLNMNTAAADMRRLAERTASDNFKVMVVGEFNRGKSTLINALLGQKVLPAYRVPTTAIINELKWGDQRRAFLYHLAPEDGGPQRIEEIPVDELEAYVMAADDDGEQGKPYEKVVLEWPLELCRDGVELVDAPGLNANPTHERITQEYLTRADAVVFVIACDYALSKTENESIAFIYGTLHYEDVFFVCTHIDAVQDEEDRVKQRVLKNLAPYTRAGRQHVYFVNALGALLARQTKDPMQWQGSGVPEVDRDLKNFLASERGRIKLGRPAYDLQDSIYQARQGILEEERLAQMDLQQLQRRYEEAQQPLTILSAQLQDISSRMRIFRSNLQRDVGDRARDFFRSLAHEPATWIVGFSPEKSMVYTKEQRESVVQETTRYLSTKANAAYVEWQDATLLPLVESEMRNKMLQEIMERVQQFDAGLDQVREGLTGVDLSTSVAVDENQVSLWSRVAGGVGGLLLGNVFSAGIGAAYGAGEMVKNLGVLVGASIASVIVTGGLSLPFILVATAAASGFQVLFKGAGESERIVKESAERMAKYFETSREELAAQVIGAIDERIAEVQAKVEQILNAELNSVRERAEGVLAEKQRDQQSAAQRSQELREIGAALDGQYHFATNLQKELMPATNPKGG